MNCLVRTDVYPLRIGEMLNAIAQPKPRQEGMVDVQQRGALKLDPAVSGKRIDHHAALDLDVDRFVGAVVDQEIEGDLVKER